MRLRSLLAFIVILVVIASAFGAFSMWRRIQEPYKGYAASEQFVDIPSGASSAEIRRRLIDAQVVRDELAFRGALWWTGESRALKAGEYRFDRPMSAVDVVQKLARGDSYVHRITFPEGLTIRQMADVYEQSKLGAAREFAAAAANGALVKDIDPQAGDLEGYLFPETYAVARHTPATRLVQMMVERFRANYPSDLQARAEAQGLRTREVVTLASLVEKETGKAEERPVVAAVYRNRMKIGMGMQADPTVVYALMQAGRYDGNIRREDLAFDSPYNTYRYPGLPPGPIASPGRASLEAALAPANVPYLYFVSRNDGSHVFATTLSEHNANVREYQILYFRNQRRAGQ